MSELSITTTQNVTINFNSASVGDRIFAHLLDMVVKIAYCIAIYFLVFSLLGLNEVLDKLDMWSVMSVVMFFGLPVMFYSLVQETFFEGQTIGKRLLKIRVIKIDGYQAGFGDYLIRWLFRMVDININMGIIGLVSMLVTNKTQRLGDMGAGTAVITLKSNITIDHTILREIEDHYVPTYPLVIKLSDNDVRIIKETYESAVKSADFNVITKLQDKIQNVTGIKTVSKSPMVFIDTVIKDYNYYTQKM